ncbi:MAG TPA: septal ring lytic transglycosylase RlpA family protein [Firmicutes bacterium]|nr:septal ring lytic transglycosylase RlpA family protein [Bacillota bacterium]
MAKEGFIVKFSLVPHLLELSKGVKVAICSTLFFGLCLGGWVAWKAPLRDCQKSDQSDGGHQENNPGWVADLELLRWEQLQINKIFHKRLAAEGKEPEPDPVLSAEPVEPAAANSGTAQAGRPDSSVGQLASRGERPNTVIKGAASWYGGGDGLDGRSTANGEIFDSSALTAAHRDLPFGTRLRVTCLNTGRSVIVRVNDRGPFNYNLILDLSRAAAEQIGLTSYGIGQVEIEIID